MRKLRAFISRVWPVMRLRTIMFGLLLLVAALPGVAAITLRVYENALVRRTEAELIAQGAALAASAAVVWPRHDSIIPFSPGNDTALTDDRDISTSIDLRSNPVLAERPAATATTQTPSADSLDLAARMAPVLAATRRVTLASILLLDQHGIVLNGRDAGRSLAGLPEVQQALAGHMFTVMRHNGAYTHPFPLEWVSRGTDIRLHHAEPIRSGNETIGVVLVSRSPRALFRGLWEDRWKIALGTGAIFVILLAMTAIVSRTIVHPLEALSRATRALAEGRRAEAPDPTLRVLEIDGLIHDFATMAAAIEHRSHYLRDFAAALAHEFKTPLSGLRGGIELLQDHGSAMDEGERVRFLANMAGDADRLTRLVSRLMELAKAEMGRASRETRCAVAPLLARLVDGMSSPSFRISADLAGDLSTVMIDPSALEAVLATLIENARQAGASHFVIRAQHDTKQVRLAISDDGPGIPTGDLGHIFEPFFTTRRTEGGTGLGLPIARALIEGNRGRLDYAASSVGCCFEITLPRG